MNDLHPLFDIGLDRIVFRVSRPGDVVHVEMPRSALKHFGVRLHSHGLLEAYDAHRDQIDAVVIRKAAEGGIGLIKVRSTDLQLISA